MESVAKCTAEPRRHCREGPCLPAALSNGAVNCYTDPVVHAVLTCPGALPDVADSDATEA